MGLTFDYADRGILPDGGRGVPVTRYNRDLFVKLVSARICGTDGLSFSFPDELDGYASIAREFRKGFMLGLGYDRTDPSLWNVSTEDFNETVGGRLQITADDILSNVQFCQGREVSKTGAEELVNGFKQHVREMTDEGRRALLRFWTGSLAPIASNTMQMVVVTDHEDGRRPYSNTCYQQMTVPLAKNARETLARLDEAVANCDAIVD
jgi:hypothetical protein